VDDLIDKKHDLSFLKDLNMNMTANGEFYRIDKPGFLSELMKTIYDDRVNYKKKMIEAKKKYEIDPTPELDREINRADNMQYALKILLNSAYGAVANRYFRWFEQRNAEAITLSGQLSIRWIEKAINAYMNKIMKTNTDYVIAVDTDSVYINFGPLIEKVSPKNPIDFLDNIAKTKFEPFIEQSYTELREYMNAYNQKMMMKRENIADKAIWTAKKRYIMNVWDSEGVRYNEPKLKMMGIEAIRSSTPKACRDYIKETLKLIMVTDQLTVQKYIDNIRKEFRTLPYEHIAFPRGINMYTKKTVNGRVVTESYADPRSIYKKATPIQVKGSLVYNHYIEKLGLEKVHEKIKDGEKIKYCYLLEPNPVQEKVIACPSDLPDDLNLKQYIDYDTQFRKGYLDPIEVILKTIGWQSEARSTLDAFFS
jgi:DNA polymerase elongation subunit (family B)